MEVPIRAPAVLTLGDLVGRDPASAGQVAPVAPAARDQASAGQVAPVAPVAPVAQVAPDQASAGQVAPDQPHPAAPDQVAPDPAFMGQAGRQPSAGISADRAT